jgi:mRNA interferase RelE/StbE
VTWLPWEVRWSSHALRDRSNLDPETQQRVDDAVTKYAETGQGDIKRLKDRPGTFRLRVGGWRIVLLPDVRRRHLAILRIKSRDHAYD